MPWPPAGGLTGRGMEWGGMGESLMGIIPYWIYDIGHLYIYVYIQIYECIYIYIRVSVCIYTNIYIYILPIGLLWPCCETKATMADRRQATKDKIAADTAKASVQYQKTPT